MYSSLQKIEQQTKTKLQPIIVKTTIRNTGAQKKKNIYRIQISLL